MRAALNQRLAAGIIKSLFVCRSHYVNGGSDGSRGSDWTESCLINPHWMLTKSLTQIERACAMWIHLKWNEQRMCNYSQTQCKPIAFWLFLLFGKEPIKHAYCLNAVNWVGIQNENTKLWFVSFIRLCVNVCLCWTIWNALTGMCRLFSLSCIQFMHTTRNNTP